MIPNRITPLNTPQQGQNFAQAVTGQSLPEQIEAFGLPWVDQLNKNMLLTVQALQRLHAAFDGKFSR